MIYTALFFSWDFVFISVLSIIASVFLNLKYLLTSSPISKSVDIKHSTPAIICNLIIPMPGTISMDIPHTISEKPYINDMIAAFAHGLFLISGSSLNFMGTHVPN